MATAKKLMESLRENVKTTLPKANDTYLQIVEIFPLQPITSRGQHDVALKIVESLISNDFKDDGAEMYLKTLAELIKDYEREQFKGGTVTGAEMLNYLMELHGFTQLDLAKELGGQSVVSKILKGERELNLRQIKALAKRFKVSPEVFI